MNLATVRTLSKNAFSMHVFVNETEAGTFKVQVIATGCKAPKNSFLTTERDKTIAREFKSLDAVHSVLKNVAITEFTVR